MADGLKLQPEHIQRLNEMLRWFERNRGLLDRVLRTTSLSAGHILQSPQTRMVRAQLTEDLEAGETATATIVSEAADEITITDAKLAAGWTIDADTVVVAIQPPEENGGEWDDEAEDWKWFLESWPTVEVEPITDAQVDGPNKKIEVKKRKTLALSAQDEDEAWTTIHTGTGCPGT